MATSHPGLPGTALVWALNVSHRGNPFSPQETGWIVTLTVVPLVGVPAVDALSPLAYSI